jgi:hypothetical protein
MAKMTKNRRREYTKEDVKLLRAHSKARTPAAKVSKLMKRSEGSLRQKARVLGMAWVISGRNYCRVELCSHRRSRNEIAMNWVKRA